ncbi:MAG: hypothetical protein PWQ82_1336 [Thermosediminibacterales bacterium]|nr:hypothetical protein [Thermosediminibacterales bacterium]
MNKGDYFQNSVDDRYFTHYVLHSFLRALSKYKGDYKLHENTLLPCRISHSEYFDNSKLLAYKNDKYYTVIGLNKGGIIKVFNDKKEIFTDFYRIFS